MANPSKNKTDNLASATVIRRASGQVSFIFKNIDEERLRKLVLKCGTEFERQYGIRFSARESDLAVMVPFADYILVRPLSANGKTATSIRAISIREAASVKEAVKELVAIYNKENQVTDSAVSSRTVKTKPTYQIAALDSVRRAFLLSDVQFQKVEELIDGFKTKLEFEDGVYYVHSSGKYRYLGVKQPNGRVNLLNITKGGTFSSLNNDPHEALSKGIVKKEVIPNF